MESFDSIDHHHNMVRRLELLPPSIRGNQVKKAVAFLNLQFVLDASDMTLVTTDVVGETARMLEKEKAVLLALSGELYVVFSVVKMMDAVVGNEANDFTPEKKPWINKVCRL